LRKLSEIFGQVNEKTGVTPSPSSLSVWVSANASSADGKPITDVWEPPTGSRGSSFGGQGGDAS